MLSMTIPAVAKLDRARSRHQYATLPPCRPASVAPIEANILRYCDAHSTSELGHQRHFRRASVTSGLPPTPDISRHRTNRRKGPIPDSCTATKQRAFRRLRTVKSVAEDSDVSVPAVRSTRDLYISCDIYIPTYRFPIRTHNGLRRRAHSSLRIVRLTVWYPHPPTPQPPGY